MREVTFWVPGDPRPKGSKNIGRTKAGQSYVYEQDAANLRKWMRSVRDAAEGHSTPWMRQVPVIVKMSFVMRATSPHHVGWHAKAPDLDKLVRAVLDGLQEGKRPLIVDDGAVVKVLAAKRWGEWPGVHITVRDAGPCYSPSTLVTADRTEVPE